MAKKQHRIVFSYHNQQQGLIAPEGGIMEVNKPVTGCLIIDGNDNVIANANVVRYHTDVDNKLVARKYAFQKAMQDLPGVENKALRTELWNRFRSEFKQPDLVDHYKIQREVRRVLNKPVKGVEEPVPVEGINELKEAI